jgi:hypothetical protein
LPHQHAHRLIFLMSEAASADFLAYLNARHERARAFLEGHPAVKQALDAIWSISSTLSYVIEGGAAASARYQCGLMWHVAAQYHSQAVAHVLAGELDSALALRRMAAELARDAYVLAKKPELLDLWMRKHERVDEYRRAFKFDRSITAGEAVYRDYKFCSSYGVHGHTTALIHSRSTATTNGNALVLSVKLDERAISGLLSDSLRATLSTLVLFCEALDLKSAANPGPYLKIAELASSLQPLLGELDAMAAPIYESPVAET